MQTLVFSLVKNRVPYYRQIQAAFEQFISEGLLKAGSELPSAQTLAEAHDVPVSCFERAYEELATKGVLISDAAGGTFRLAEAREEHREGPPSEASAEVPAAPAEEPAVKTRKKAARVNREPSRYTARGVSATKREVHAAVENLQAGLFPKAFCKVLPDVLTGNPELCNVIHSDGSGSKAVIAYLYWKETGDASVFRGIAQDSIVMNLDDLLCIGCTGRILLSSTINRNARRIPGAVLAELIQGTEAFLESLRGQGVEIYSGGGETADVGDLTPTLTVDSCAASVMRRSDVLSGEAIRPGLAIVGLSSVGKANWESMENSGIGSNGLTSARHELLKGYYRKNYPETYDDQTPKELVYNGPFRLTDPLPGSDMTVGQALLSPTRTYAPVLSELLKTLRSSIRGVVHCSGGGQTKCLRFGTGVHYVKDRMMPIPPLFEVIQKTSDTKWREMYQVYNMGHRMEVYCEHDAAGAVVDAASRRGIAAAVIGETLPSTEDDNANHLTVIHGSKALSYRL